MVLCPALPGCRPCESTRRIGRMLSHGLQKQVRITVLLNNTGLRGAKRMKRKLLIVSVLAILVAVTAAGTLAYFTDTGTAHNVITTGNVKIELKEWEDEACTQPFQDKTGVMPGTKVTKIVKVENTGTGAAFLRLYVEKNVYDANQTPMKSDPVSLNFNDTDWTYSESEGYYYYNRPLEPGKTTEPLFTAVTFAAEMDNRYQNATAHVKVIAYAVQSANNGDSPQAAKGWPSDTQAEPTPVPNPPENP